MSGGAKYRCTYCPDKYPGGHLVSHSTLLRHEKAHVGDKDDATSDTVVEAADRAVEETMDHAIDDAFSVHGTEETDETDETDKTDETDETDQYAHLCIDWETGSTDQEFGKEMNNDETLESLCSTLDAILIEDEADELDSNSDDDVDKDDTDINLNEADLAFVELARLRSKGMSREMYEEVRRIMRTLKVELPCLRRSQHRLQQWTKILPKFLDCCVNSCLAYTGAFEHERVCPRCNELRYSTTGRPRKQFLYIPVAHRLVLQYSDADRARVLKSYRQTYSNQPGDAGRQQLRDIFDGALYNEFHLRELGLFRDPHDIALQLSLDGVQLTNMRNHEV